METMNTNRISDRTESQQQRNLFMPSQPLRRAALCALGLILASGCTPTVQVAAPSEPITINLNVKIKHEILVKVDKEIDTMLDENSELF
jgi:hypothetical protein